MATEEEQTTHRSASEGSSVAATVPKTEKRKSIQRKELPPYNVILLDDSDHTYEYVMELARALFGYPQEEGFRLAQEVDSRGRAILLTTHKEKAELKRDQIHAFGTDVRVATCKGSMTAYIEPVEG
jgi:ATP-dependent Clp protease adaptor protein ClpS